MPLEATMISINAPRKRGLKRAEDWSSGYNSHNLNQRPEEEGIKTGQTGPYQRCSGAYLNQRPEEEGIKTLAQPESQCTQSYISINAPRKRGLKP